MKLRLIISLFLAFFSILFSNNLAAKNCTPPTSALVVPGGGGALCSATFESVFNIYYTPNPGQNCDPIYLVVSISGNPTDAYYVQEIQLDPNNTSYSSNFSMPAPECDLESDEEVQTYTVSLSLCNLNSNGTFSLIEVGPSNDPCNLFSDATPGSQIDGAVGRKCCFETDFGLPGEQNKLNNVLYNGRKMNQSSLVYPNPLKSEDLNISSASKIVNIIINGATFEVKDPKTKFRIKNNKFNSGMNIINILDEEGRREIIKILKQ